MYNDICQEQISKKEKINVLKDTFIAIDDCGGRETGNIENFGKIGRMANM